MFESTTGLILIRNANIYAPQPLGIKNLLIGGGKILAVTSEELELPKSLISSNIDLEGQTLTPGFIDAHAHITGGGGEAGFATQVPPVPLSQFTAFGVTTVVGLLGTDDTTRSTANLLSRVYGLREEGMSAYCWTGGYHYPLTTLTNSAREDIVYLDPVIGIGEFAISDHRSSQPDFNEVIRIASDAHVAGLMTGKAGVVHFHLGDGSRKLELIKRAINETELPARVFNPTHVNRNKPLFDESCEMLSEGIYMDITAFPEDSLEEGWSAAQALLLAKERNCPMHQITVSSDGGGCMPEFNQAGEMIRMGFGRSETLVETIKSCTSQGMSLEDVLSSLTANVAQLLRLSQKGNIRVGADADLVVLDSDYSICNVMALGQWHMLNKNLIVTGTFE
ncbi:beta-aspartyl-peptidase [uncultured Cocleimonas sp.]|uniref:beta-aspartyl-peptidase n=1 Tax=uncultured Cocleimonas sp. TaxID=1051587 RepID=UPI002636AFCE|nr:beta-aspartyl-peptidase [uncultured Cocleimonas sp.]